MKLNMKKSISIKILVVLIIIAIACLINFISFAGMADMTDEKAENIDEKQMEEQNKAYVDPIGKSSDNFLESLSVENYTLTPNFDKQTINYEIKETVETNEINIIAKAENEKAVVTGAGEIKLLAGENNIKIDVTAENGIMRSYFINVKTNKKSNENAVTNNLIDSQLQENENSVEENDISVSETQANANFVKKNTNIKIYIIIAIIVVLGLIIVILIAKRRSNKHRAKH